MDNVKKKIYMKTDLFGIYINIQLYNTKQFAEMDATSMDATSMDKIPPFSTILGRTNTEEINDISKKSTNYTPC